MDAMIRMSDEEFERNICEVPHLDLTRYLPPVPVQTIIHELQQNMQCISMFEYSRSASKAVIDHLRETWQGFSLVDVTALGSHMIDYYTTNLTHERVRDLGVKMKEDGYAEFQVTDIGQRMPVTTAYTTSLFKDLCRIRVSKVKAGREIYYHCHLQKAKRNPDKIVPDNSYRSTMHIPLISNDKCSFSVTKDTGFAGHPDDFEKHHGEEFWQHYAPGEVWMFNSVHYHKAVNHGAADRFHLLIYFDFMDEKIRPVIEKALSEYTGPRIR
jgi:hypothetical protein